MSFDIYGNRLYPGNCEVHPWITEEYPCYVCRKQQEDVENNRRAEIEYYKQMEAEQYKQVRESFCNQYFYYRLLCFIDKMTIKFSLYINAKKNNFLDKVPF